MELKRKASILRLRLFQSSKRDEATIFSTGRANPEFVISSASRLQDEKFTPLIITRRVRKTWIMGFAIAVIAVPACLFVATFNPSEYGFFPKCLFFVATGFYCPGCGATRSLHHLLNGRIAQAFGMNPLIFLSAPFLIALGLYPQLARQPRVPIIAGIVLVSYGILRNIPAFSFLAP